MTLFKSLDSGATWSEAAQLYPPQGEAASYSCVEEANSEILVLWELGSGGTNCDGLCRIGLHHHRPNVSGAKGAV
jgi:hypothetical protein